MQNDEVMSTEKTAEYLGVEIRTLENWRSENKGPRYYKPTGKLIFYFKSDLDAWIKSEGEKNG